MKKLFILLLIVILTISAESQTRSIKIMAANISSGNNQQYEGPGIRIFKALKPDICCIQEFNYNGDIDSLVAEAFGADYYYYRESYTSSGSIPNGIIYHKDFKIIDSGSWTSSQISNRGYAYARLDVPGDNNPHMFVVSVHLSTTAEKRRVEAQELIKKINQYYGVSSSDQIKDYVVLGGDFNVGSRNTEVMVTLKKLFVDSHIPVDQKGNDATNSSRAKVHDFVIVNSLLEQYHSTLKIGSNSFPNGLVFDSRVYSPLSEVSPVLKEDCGATNMQHMAVVKLFVVPEE